MDIMELGAIGELVGGTAVLVTLIYLALQVRQGNKAGSRDSYRIRRSPRKKAIGGRQVRSNLRRRDG